MQYNQQKHYNENLGIKSFCDHFKPELQRIFNISLKNPIIPKQASTVFTLNEFERKKINYLIKLGQQENHFEVNKPYFNFFYKYNLPAELINRWKIRGIYQKNEHFIIDVYGAQYMKKVGGMTTSGEKFLYPDIIGTQKLDQQQINLDKIISEVLKEGKDTTTKSYPLVENHKALYQLFGLLFMCKFLYRVYLIGIQ